MQLRLTLILALALSACGSNAEPDDPIVIDFEPDDGKADVIDEPPTPTLADEDCPDDSVLTYENFGGPFMRNWCTGCHNSELPQGERAQATLGVDLETRDLVVDWAERVWFRSAENTTMPPGGGPSDEEREQLAEWLACGAP